MLVDLHVMSLDCLDDAVLRMKGILTFISNGAVQKCKTQRDDWMLTSDMSENHPVTAICNQIRLACLAGWQGGAAAPQCVELHSIQSCTKSASYSHSQQAGKRLRGTDIL